MISLFDTLCEVCAADKDGLSLQLLSTEQWTELWALALRHKVGPLFVDRVKGLSLEPPDEIATVMAKHVQKNVIAGLNHSAELFALTRMFESAGVEFLCFKGLALMKLAGLEFSQRQIGDMDLLLVHTSDIALADRLLVDSGYERLTLAQSLDMSAAKRRYFLKCEKDIVYFHPGKRIRLEVHFKLFQRSEIFPVKNTCLYRQREYAQIAGAEIPVMSKRDHQLYLLVHGAFTQWHRLKWVCDIPFISNNGADYFNSTIEDRIQALGLKRVSCFGLVFVNNCLSMPVSPAVEDYAEKTKAIRSLLNSARAALRRKEYTQLGKREEALHWLKFVLFYQTQLTASISIKLKLIGAYLTRTSDWEVIKLPDQFFWLYVFLRPLIWTIRKIKTNGTNQSG